MFRSKDSVPVKNWFVTSYWFVTFRRDPIFAGSAGPVRTDLKATKCGRLSSGIGENVDKVILGLQVDSLSCELR